YDEQIANPKNFDRGAVAIKCLVDAGLVAANYSSENLAADLFWDDPNHPNVDDVQGPVPPEAGATPLDITGLSAADCLRVLSGGPGGGGIGHGPDRFARILGSLPWHTPSRLFPHRRPEARSP